MTEPWPDQLLPLIMDIETAERLSDLLEDWPDYIPRPILDALINRIHELESIIECLDI